MVESVTSTDTSRKSQTVEFIQFASVISAVAVIYLHSNGCFWQFSETARYWKTSNVIQCVFYFAVPVFFMISGATLFDFYERYNLKEYFKKRIGKTVIPYVFWSIVGYFFVLLFINDGSFNEISLKTIVSGLVTGKLVSIYWFFIPLFCAYLCVPLFAAVKKEKRNEVFALLLIASFLINILAPFIMSLVGINTEFPWKIDACAGYLFYFLMGYMIVNNDLSKKTRSIIYIAGIAGLLAHIIGTHILSLEAGTIVQTYKGYNNVPCVLYSTAVFCVFKYAGSALMKNHVIKRVIVFLSKYTFSIYLIHIFILQTLIKYGCNYYSIYYRMLSPIVAIAGTIVITYLMRKIPLGRNILP